MRASWMLAMALLLCSCGTPQAPVNGGDAARGAAAIFRYGCGSCHTITQLNYAHGLVGPPLTGLRDRLYVAGMLQNNPENLEHWIRDPKSINEKTAMPNLGVTPQDAMDIAAYLYSK
jgi:cytochrome c